MLQTKGGLDLLLKDQSSMLELATYFQRGLHSGLDIIMDPDFQSYDSLLTLSLQERGITLPYRIEYLRFSHTLDSTQFFYRYLGSCRYSGLHPRTGCTYLRLYFRHPFTLALPPPDGFCSRSYCPADGWYTYYFIYHFVDIRILFLVLDPYIAETENTGRNEK